MKNTAAARLLRSQLALAKPLINNCSLSAMRWGQDKLGKMLPGQYKSATSCEELTIHGLSCAMITPKDEISSGVILYLHGGGYIAGRLDYAKGFATVLSANCGMRVLAVA